jgi:ribosomal protein S18 acetylase RimI-like enzyme
VDLFSLGRRIPIYLATRYRPRDVTAAEETSHADQTGVPHHRERRRRGPRGDHRLTERAARTDIHVRRATPADMEAVGRLGALLVRTHHEFDPKRFIAARPRTAESYASFLGSQLEDPDVTVLAAEEQGRVIGYAYAASEDYDWMSLRGPAGVLHDIIVDPEARGRGAGRLLLEATLDFLRSRGAPRVVLSTAARNASAQRLFASAGFRDTMIEMTRELDGPG